MTATDFTTAVTVWTGAIVAASAVITPAVLLLLKRINDVEDAGKAMHAKNSVRIDQHDSIAGVVTSPSGAVNSVGGKQPLTVASPVLGK